MGMQKVEVIEKLAKALVPLKFIVKKICFPKNFWHLSSRAPQTGKDTISKTSQTRGSIH